MPEPFWDTAYRADAEPFGPPAADVLELLDRLPIGARVLDLGCGDGRNAFPAARAGHRVTAVDCSKYALESLRRRLAREPSPEGGERIEIEVVQADLATFSPLDRYDLVIAHGVLHLLRPPDRDWLIDRVRAHTRFGGWHLVVAFTSARPPPPDLAPFFLGVFDPGELLLRYSDWKVERAESYIERDEHPGGIRHEHAIDRIIARRPST